MSCKCQSCGKQYHIDVGVPDEIWERIKPHGKAEGAGLLCGSCIMERLETMGSYGFYELVKIRAHPMKGIYKYRQKQCKNWR